MKEYHIQPYPSHFSFSFHLLNASPQGMNGRANPSIQTYSSFPGKIFKSKMEGFNESIE